MYTLLVFAFGYAALSPLEVRLRGRSRRSRRANLAMILPTLLAAGLVGAALAGVTLWGDQHDVGVLPWLGLSGPLAAVVAFLAIDLQAYVDHRFRHRLTLLWRLHRAHHTDTDVDVTTALRNHPMEAVSIVLFSSLFVVVLGAQPGVVAAASLVGAVASIWVHVRLALPGGLERRLATVIQTPGMHRVHHSPDRPSTDSNYGLVLSTWDHVFGTYSAPDPHRRTGLDTADLEARQSFRAMLVDPWRPQVPAAPVGLLDRGLAAEPAAPAAPAA